MNWLVGMLRTHWLSVLLLIALFFAIRFVYKRKEKFAKNEFE